MITVNNKRQQLQQTIQVWQTDRHPFNGLFCRTT